MSAEALDALAQARAEFDHWRSHGSGRGRLPSHLWALATSLVGTYSVAAVARELGLNQGRLRARLRKESTAAPKRRASKPTFVELRPTAPELRTASPTASDLAESVDLVRLTLERPDGTALTLAVPASSPALAERLIASFTTLVA